MASKLPAKSILKQPSAKKKSADVTDQDRAQAEKDRTNLKIALHHAYRIQHQKDAEAQILASIEALLELPAAAAFTSREGLAFIQHVTAFQPSDFDSLVEERRIDGKCAYSLCSNPPRAKSMGRSAEWKLKKGMGDYCSNDCAKKNLFVKAQLSEVPVWERAPEQQPEIELHEDDRPPEDDATARRANRAARVDAWRKKVANGEDLAAERGETTASFRPNQVMADSIIEKRSLGKAPKAPDADVEEFLTGTGGSIEGFTPKKIGRDPFSKHQSHDSDEDDDDED